MPIITDKKKFSFEFFYEFEGEDSQNITFPIKYLWGNYGPTIQVFFPDGTGVELPADIFGEIANFLAQQGILAPTMPATPMIPSVGGKSMTVPLLKGASASIIAHRQPQAHTPQSHNPLMPPTTAMSQVINPLAPRVETSGQNVHQVESEVPSLSNEEIMSARLAAKKRADAEGVVNKFRKGHVDGGYIEPNEAANKRASKAADAIEAENE